MKSYAVTLTTANTIYPLCPTAAENAAFAAPGYAGVQGLPQTVHVANAGAITCYIGGADVTTANGFPLATGASIEIDLMADNLYATAGTDAAVLSVLRTG